jgi:hypothetical protein
VDHENFTASCASSPAPGRSAGGCSKTVQLV